MQTEILSPQTEKSAIEKAGKLLRAGEIVVIPTETVYGLAADALNAQAVKKIYRAKGRPSDNPLIVHISSFEEIFPLVREVPERAKKLAEAFWPGPLTMILPKSEKIPDVTSGGLDTVAIRLPAHPTAQAIIRATGRPLAAPSANISGFPSPTRPGHVIDDMTGRVPLIIEDGDCTVGVESTVITLATEKPKILRPGGITKEMLEAVLKEEVALDEAVLSPLKQGKAAASPGMKYKHYAPKTNITIYRGTEKGYYRFLKKNQGNGVYALCFEEDVEKISLPCVTMGSFSDPLSQTRRLFDAFRELDELGAHTAYARIPSADGIGLAVCNRLFRAAAFRFHDEAPILGLTGQTGAGKSMAASLFQERGYSIIDCDQIAHEITAAGSPVLSALASKFGNEILRSDGSLNRQKLAELAFSSKENTKALNAITHPAIIQETKRLALLSGEKNHPCVIDAPLLFQSGLDAICDFTIAVIAPTELRLARIEKRDQIDENTAKKRNSAQEEESYYKERADFLIRNYPPYELKDEVLSVMERVRI